jgi:hypothetical protein
MFSRVDDLDCWWKPPFALLWNLILIKDVDNHFEMADFIKKTVLLRTLYTERDSLLRSEPLLLVSI